MNFKTLSAYVIIVLCLCQCSKVSMDEVPEVLYGEIEAFKNEQKWEDIIIFGNDHTRDIHRPPYLQIGIVRYNAYNIRRENLSFAQIPCEVGIQYFETLEHISFHDKPYTSYNTVVADGDVLGDIYYVDINKINYIIIDSIEGKKIWGNFNITMIRDTSRERSYMWESDTININCVEFSLELNPR